jgi:NAD(P)-dependent dehydrogenase (short-subunit alcohol dehydrogenase family)
MMSARLSGKVCVITGTGGSVGRADALAFAREGASVVGCDVNVAAAEATVEMVRAQGGTMISLQPCHLTEPSECQALVDLNRARVRPDRRAVQQRRDGVLQLARRHYQRGMEPRSGEEYRPGFCSPARRGRI